VYFIYFRGSKISGLKQGEGELNILLPIRGLFIVSVVVGSAYVWVFLPPCSIVFTKLVKIRVFGLSLIFAGLMRMVVRNTLIGEGTQLRKNMGVLGQIWFLHFLRTLNFIGVIKRRKKYFKFLDSGWLEVRGGQGGMRRLIKFSSIPDKLNILHLKLYIFIMFAGALIILIL
jgi:hypothetical protein